MPRLLTASLLMLSLALPMGCRATADPSSPVPEAAAGSGPGRTDIAPLMEVIRAQERAWNEGSVEAFMAAGYWDSPDMTFLSGGDWTRGYDTVLARYRRRYVEGDARMGRLEFSGLEALRLAPDLGLVRGRWQLFMDGGEAPWGLFTLLMERLPDVGWRVVHDHTSVGADPETE